MAFYNDPITVGTTIASIMVLWDNATDYGAADVEKTWNFGFVHVPTLLVDGGVILIAVIGWAFSKPGQTPMVAESTVMGLLWSLPVALLVAWLWVQFILPIYNKLVAGLDKLLAWLPSLP